eukprot:CAMPEP_0174975930 /NCGR_PEP_ID=MMETSP0004_2-20121128/12725_1 /TAXON_ID=420556 /ORGANISM="Ochromonas sp., Strain CCMP1393" /LENGTH=268 /DNA_ID=CAMNT_0016226853 /DNA_START=111 /DNA_END=914 /DNA_ORIENTATION=-
MNHARRCSKSYSNLQRIDPCLDRHANEEDIISILHEDNHLVVVSKPPNMLVQGDGSGASHLTHWVASHIARTYSKPGSVFAAPVHRIDRLCSGVVLFARTSKAAARLAESFRRRQAQKSYICVVHGVVSVDEQCKGSGGSAANTVAGGSVGESKGEWIDCHHVLSKPDSRPGARVAVRMRQQKRQQRGHGINNSHGKMATDSSSSSSTWNSPRSAGQQESERRRKRPWVHVLGDWNDAQGVVPSVMDESATGRSNNNGSNSSSSSSSS